MGKNIFNSIASQIRFKPLQWRIKISSLFLALSWAAYSFSYDLAIPNVFNRGEEILNVSGEFPFSKGWSMGLQVVYESTNSACLKKHRLFGLIPMSDSLYPMRHFSIYAPEQIKGSDNYVISIKSKDLVGFCNWTPSSFAFIIKDKNKEKVYFVDNGFDGEFPPSLSAKLLCSKDIIERLGKDLNNDLAFNYKCAIDLKVSHDDFHYSNDKKKTLSIDFKLKG